MMFTSDAYVSNLIIREWLNGSLFPLSLNLSLVIAIFMWQSFILSRSDPEMRTWWRMPGVPTACSLFWIFSLDGIRAMSVWIILRITNNGMEVPEWIREWTNHALIVAALGLGITILRCTYLFTPPKWGNRYWIYSAASTLLFLILSHILP